MSSNLNEKKIESKIDELDKCINESFVNVKKINELMNRCIKEYKKDEFRKQNRFYY